MGGHRAAIALCFGFLLRLAAIPTTRSIAGPDKAAQKLEPVAGASPVKAIVHLPNEGDPVDPLTQNAPAPPTYDSNGVQVVAAAPATSTILPDVNKPAMIQEQVNSVPTSQHASSNDWPSSNEPSRDAANHGGVVSFSRFNSFLQAETKQDPGTGSEEDCSCYIGGYCYQKGSCVAIAMGWVAVLLIVLLIMVWVLQFVIAIPTEWVIVRRTKRTLPIRQPENNPAQVEGSSAYNTEYLLSVGEECYR